MRGLPGRTSRAVTYLSSVTLAGSTKQRNTSLPVGPTWKSSETDRTTSGWPSFQPSLNFIGAGASLESPSGVLLSAQAARTAISLSLRRRSLWNAMPSLIFHGGIRRD